MNSEKSKTSGPYRLLLDLSNYVNLKKEVYTIHGKI